MPKELYLCSNVFSSDKLSLILICRKHNQLWKEDIPFDVAGLATACTKTPFVLMKHGL
jgi:hypothetical protein